MDTREVLQASLRAGESTTMIAERLLDAKTSIVEVPEYVRKLRAAAKFPRGPGDRNLFEEAVEKYADQIDRLGQGATRSAGEFTMRSASKQLVTDLRKAKPEQIDTIVDRWILERARYQARIVARHESVEAFRDAAKKQAAAQPWVVALRWTLSGSHPKEDICDVLAQQDLHGFGPGGYPIESTPDTPHTSCLCSLVSIPDAGYLKRELAKAKGIEPPPKTWLSGKQEKPGEWYAQQTEATRKALGGPTRALLAGKGVNVMDAKGGKFLPVHELLGRPAPVISRGPSVDATKLVKRDRQTMVRPFAPIKM